MNKFKLILKSSIIAFLVHNLTTCSVEGTLSEQIAFDPISGTIFSLLAFAVSLKIFLDIHK